MTLQVLRWLWRHFRPAHGRVVFVLLLAAAYSAAAAVVAGQWVSGDRMFYHVALVGCLWGTVLGRPRVKTSLAVLGAISAGLAYMGIAVTRLHEPVFYALSARWLEDRAAYSAWLQEAANRITMLAEQVRVWLSSWRGGEAIANSTVSLFLLALLLWLAATYAGWATRRGKAVLVSLFPLTLLVALGVYLSNEGEGEAAVFLLFVIAMSPLATLAQEQATWQERELSYPDDLAIDAGVLAAIAGSIFLTMAWTVPVWRVRTTMDWYWRLTQGSQESREQAFERALPGARRPAARTYGRVQQGAVLPTDHLLGGAARPLDEVVMLVRTDDPAPMLDEFSEPNAQRVDHYWRSGIYGEYLGAGWRQIPTQREEVPAYTELEPSGTAHRRPLRQGFSITGESAGILFAAADPSSFDQAVTLLSSTSTDEVVSVGSYAQSYQVFSLVPDVTAEDMAAAVAAYPESIARAYLQLPENLPERVVSLSADIVEDLANPFQKALLIESFVRKIPYDLTVPLPPADRDVVDYFIFDLQRGYCDYHASAMVVLARAAGIPARLAVGYATGSYDFELGVYVVTGMEAHAWPELYFPGLGWIAFEPTAGFVTRLRIDPVTQATSGAWVPPALPERSWRVRMEAELRQWWGLNARHVVGAVLTAAAAGLALLLLYRHRRSRDRDPAARLYEQLRVLAASLGTPLHESDTPREFEDALQMRLQSRQPRAERLTDVIVSDSRRVTAIAATIVRAYELSSYAAHKPDQAMLRQAEAELSAARLPSWRLRALSS